MAQLKNRVPYEVAFKARDLASSKPISNILYFRSVLSGGVYGADLPGGTVADLAEVAKDMWTLGPGNVMDSMSANYEMQSVVARSIEGRRYGTPIVGIASISPSLADTHIRTVTPHGYVNGNTVVIFGQTDVPLANGTWPGITVVSATEFVIALPPSGSSMGGGGTQKASGNQQWLYGDLAEVVDGTIGGRSGDALPLFSSASVRRVSDGVGRTWRQHVSLSPMAEQDASNGRLSNAIITTINTALGTWSGATLAAGTVSMKQYAVSRQLAFMLATPFTDSTTWAKPVSSYFVRQNMGSIVRRKPKLTSLIVP